MGSIDGTKERVSTAIRTEEWVEEWEEEPARSEDPAEVTVSGVEIEQEEAGK